MESKDIYEESYEELKRINKILTSSDSVNIQLDKLDTETKGKMISAIRGVISDRMGDIQGVFLGVQ